jgi:mono/diheme cytochrome c family protein
MKKAIGFMIGMGAVILMAYFALVYYDNNFRYGRMRETPAVRPHEEPLLIMEAGTVPFSGGEMNYLTGKPDDLKSPLEMNNPETIQRGQAVYFTFCAQCHGKNHDGNAPVGQSFSPLPTDLRSPKVQTELEGNIFWNISYGLPEGKGRQPALATTIEVFDRWRAVAYVKSLGVRE